MLRFSDEGSELQQMLTGGDVVPAQAYASTPARLILAAQPTAGCCRARAAWASSTTSPSWWMRRTGTPAFSLVLLAWLARARPAP